ncbi:LCP family protein [Patescibacteria group bacterium]|nr:LCP family protein [Patescibacteria group bacterium]MBU0879394.1 LCP family protein [Patescibacteria group bacterium]MBU0880074.1 LCP family protein [Patescibacteria group bacterium]MBU1062746.1 LCP family protein [Patescibacteria group bacterium]MBU1783009.1 LCP family protein [Patescibacteria group bacterium]
MNRKINLLDAEQQSKINEHSNSLTKKHLINQPKSKKNKTFFYIFIFFLLTGFCFFFKANHTNQSLTSSTWINNLPIFSNIKQLAESTTNKLKGSDRGRINILFLGMGGKNHDGAYLTDTIILASFEPSTKKIALISIPRDMAAPIENVGWRKINSINALAEVKEQGSGGLAVSQAVNDILNIPIDYYIRVDFTGFEKIINELGGVNVYVDNTFDDYRYPIIGNESAPWEERYQHLHLDQGWQEMDGSLALKYARSRHAFGVEGSDFARARRQQKILKAAKDKISSFDTLLNPVKVSGLINQVQNNLDTNLKIWEMLQLWNTFKDIKEEQIITKVLDDGPGGLLTNTTSEDGAYILLPRGGDFSEIQYLINNVFTDAPAEDKTKVNMEKASIEVRNGTWINGLANKVSMDLEKYGFNIVRVSNSSQQNFQKSVIYDLTYGKKIESLSVLKNKTNANVSLGLPQWLQNDLAQELIEKQHPIQPDFILVLGTDADASQSGVKNKEE